MALIHEQIAELFEKKRHQFPPKQTFTLKCSEQIFEDEFKVPAFQSASWYLGIRLSPCKMAYRFTEPILAVIKRREGLNPENFLFHTSYEQVRLHHLGRFLDLMSTNAFTSKEGVNFFSFLASRDRTFYSRAQDMIGKCFED